MRRPGIKKEIKEEVRKQCLFGCAICGSPFFEYDHIEEYSVVKEHTANNLILLCPTHHAAKTTGKLSKDRIKEAKLNPYNANNAFTANYNVGDSKKIEIKMGTNTTIASFSDVYYCLWVNGTSFLTIYNEEGRLSVSLIATDSKGTKILEISKGELMVSTFIKDYNYVGNLITVVGNDESVLLQMSLTNDIVHVHAGNFLQPYNDGFIVKDGYLISRFHGEDMGFTYGMENGKHTNGDWALINDDYMDRKDSPKGFGSSYWKPY